VNILNKQSKTADKRWSSRLEVRRRAKTPHRKKKNSLLRNITRSLENSGDLVNRGSIKDWEFLD
jgi:hypothetical protein